MREGLGFATLTRNPITLLGDGIKTIVVSMDVPTVQRSLCAREGIASLETISDHRDASFGTPSAC